MIPKQSIAPENKMCSFPVKQTIKEDGNNFCQYIAALYKLIVNYKQQLLLINQKYGDIKFESSLRLSSLVQLMLLPFDNFSNRLTLATTRYKTLVQDVNQYFYTFYKLQISPVFQQDYERDFQNQHQKLHIDLQIQFLGSVRQLAYTLVKYCDFVGGSIKFLREPPLSLLKDEPQESIMSTASITTSQPMQTSQSYQSYTPQNYIPMMGQPQVPEPQMSYLPSSQITSKPQSDAPVI